MKKYHLEIDLLCTLSAFIGRKYDNIIDHKYEWINEVIIDFLNNECLICIALDSTLFNDQKLHYAIVGKCKEFGLNICEYESWDDCLPSNK
ncbi:hypothetical protein SAMN04487906_1818 [Zhouia amylolytica]|uniref:Uncharacterized protein n=2 Tax=Zhouia amylolytica TaxID=376730 RepID=A0A1I6T302_9FLAO|nr:hypothetical protein SAMN04487906_1818 [Zhouia amylolytica]